MGIERLAGPLLEILKAGATLVDAGDKIAAGSAIFSAAKEAFRTISDALSDDDQAALQARLDALAERVNAHAAATAASLD